MKNWTFASKTSQHRLKCLNLNKNNYEHSEYQVREEWEYMELRWNKLSADVAFQMSKHLSPHKHRVICKLRFRTYRAPFCSLQLLGSARDTAGTGTQQHGNYWINSMKLIVSVVNSITVFWVCFIWSNYALPYVCKSVLHLAFFSSLLILQALMTEISPMSLTQDQKAPSRLCTAWLFVTCSSSFQESTF